MPFLFCFLFFFFFFVLSPCYFERERETKWGEKERQTKALFFHTQIQYSSSWTVSRWQATNTSLTVDQRGVVFVSTPFDFRRVTLDRSISHRKDLFCTKIKKVKQELFYWVCELIIVVKIRIYKYSKCIRKKGKENMDVPSRVLSDSFLWRQWKFLVRVEWILLRMFLARSRGILSTEHFASSRCFVHLALVVRAWNRWIEMRGRWRGIRISIDRWDLWCKCCVWDGCARQRCIRCEWFESWSSCCFSQLCRSDGWWCSFYFDRTTRFHMAVGRVNSGFMKFHTGFRTYRSWFCRDTSIQWSNMNSTRILVWPEMV